ncbi:unnamed protein product [Somion occarium]|uniref:CxC5 like cysteine cluster associated with KDZ domain-containing protein n=2 Tax=Somion occarium TaxID=3059160 RepID=A0ABP1E8M5_9APHY
MSAAANEPSSSSSHPAEPQTTTSPPVAILDIGDHRNETVIQTLYNLLIRPHEKLVVATDADFDFDLDVQTMDLNVVLNAMAYVSSVSLEDRIALSVTEAQDKLTFHISRELDDQQPDDLVAFWKEQWLRFRVLSKNLTHCHARDDLGYFDSEVGLSPVAVATTEDIVEAIILRGVPKLRVLLEDYKFSYEYGWLSYYWRCILDPVHRDLYKVLDKMHLLLSRLQKLLAVTEINKPVLVSTTRQLLALKEEYEREEDVWLEKHADRAAYRDYVEHGGPKPKIDYAQTLYERLSRCAVLPMHAIILLSFAKSPEFLPWVDFKFEVIPISCPKMRLQYTERPAAKWSRWMQQAVLGFESESPLLRTRGIHYASEAAKRVKKCPTFDACVHAECALLEYHHNACVRASREKTDFTLPGPYVACSHPPCLACRCYFKTYSQSPADVLGLKLNLRYFAGDITGRGWLLPDLEGDSDVLEFHRLLKNSLAEFYSKFLICIGTRGKARKEWVAYPHIEFVARNEWDHRLRWGVADGNCFPAITHFELFEKDLSLHESID